MDEVRYENLDKWTEKYYDIPEAKRTEYEALQTSAEKAEYNGLTAAQKAIIDEGPEPVNTANIMVRGGAFRTYYEISMMAVLDARTKGTDESDGQWCPVHEKYDDDCDDVDHNKFIGTPGTVNLGVESFGEDMLRDGRIQLVDVYGQGKLVLLDGGAPIYENPEADPYEGMTEEEILAAEQEKREEKGEVTATPVNTYQTEGGFRQYRLYISDLELWAMQYLTVQPNTALTNSTNASFALKTYWGTGSSVAVDGWAADEPLLEMRYGATNDSLKCKITLAELEKAIAAKKGDPDWSFRSGELYRVTFSVEGHLGYGYLGSQKDGEVEFVNHLQPARAESSILFRCVSIDENKDGTHSNTNGTSVAGKVPDWTPLQFVNQ